MSKLRIDKPLNKRYGPGYAVRRAAKRADRATFRQQAQTSFGQINQGLHVMDHAIVGVYEQFVLAKHIQLTLTAVLAGLVSRLYPGVTGTVIAALAFALSVYTVYSVVITAKRARDAKEQALLAALAQQQRAGIAPPPQQPRETEVVNEGN